MRASTLRNTSGWLLLFAGVVLLVVAAVKYREQVSNGR